ncbi:MAG: 30S ribosomal protein S21 [Candidatus Terrybacteria bacterium]|nr:30S ribosomal protein S21 [Candidatus Terrybacteria bacterium]
MIEVKKGENESTANLVRRFTKKIHESGILGRVRSLKFRKRSQSDLKKKEAAVKKARLKQKMNFLRKLGKID